ncbi:Uncharacterized protein HZ326_17869 [Fusarium oxysporum f. sp. albedinis]|nr:Uncharacterized protein HZ326_17869 [Fusarium oxysporum f. sp. albedinis]
MRKNLVKSTSRTTRGMCPNYVTAQKTAAMHGTWVSHPLSGGCVGNVSMCFLFLECSQAAKHHYEERARVCGSSPSECDMSRPGMVDMPVVSQCYRPKLSASQIARDSHFEVRFRHLVLRWCGYT